MSSNKEGPIITLRPPETFSPLYKVSPAGPCCNHLQEILKLNEQFYFIDSNQQ